jgi:hypothetical protein
MTEMYGYKFRLQLGRLPAMAVRIMGDIEKGEEERP